MPIPRTGKEDTVKMQYCHYLRVRHPQTETDICIKQINPCSHVMSSSFTFAKNIQVFSGPEKSKIREKKQAKFLS